MRELREFEQQRGRESLDAERVEYAERRARERCCPCKGSGQMLMTGKNRAGHAVGRTCPCPTCRPADHQAFLEALRPAPAPHRV